MVCRTQLRLLFIFHIDQFPKLEIFSFLFLFLIRLSVSSWFENQKYLLFKLVEWVSLYELYVYDGDFSKFFFEAVCKLHRWIRQLIRNMTNFWPSTEVANLRQDTQPYSRRAVTITMQCGIARAFSPWWLQLPNNINRKLIWLVANCDGAASQINCLH